MPLNFARFGGVAAAASVLLAAGQALAQPVAPAAPGAQPAPGAPPGPIHVDLTPMEPQWTKVCGPDPAAGNKQTCLTSRSFAQSQAPTMSVAVYQTAGEEKHSARFLLPIGMLLKPGFRVILDKGEPIDGKFAICFPNYCLGEIEFGPPTLAALKKAQTLSTVMKNQANIEVTFTAPLKDFAAAFDGPAIDPKVLQQQQEELQKQLEAQAKKQRDELEQQSQKGLQSAAPATPAPAPAATPAK